MKNTTQDMRKIAELGDIQIIRLRKDITLGSVFIRDYENRYGLDPHAVCAFFDGFEDCIEELMLEDGYTDADYLDKRPEYDNAHNLRAWRDMVACSC